MIKLPIAIVFWLWQFPILRQQIYFFVVQCYGSLTGLIYMNHTEHPWMREGGDASDKPIDSAVLSRMKQFRAMNKLKKLALKVCLVA